MEGVYYTHASARTRPEPIFADGVGLYYVTTIRCYCIQQKSIGPRCNIVQV